MNTNVWFYFEALVTSDGGRDGGGEAIFSQ